MNLPHIKELLHDHLPLHFNKGTTIEFIPIGGGSINDTYQVKTKGGNKFFLKLNSTLTFPHLFEKEKNGLEFLGKQDRILIPNIILCETTGDAQLLLLEWIETGHRHENFWKIFGEQLAQLHSVTQERFGFIENNYMGSLQQENTLTNDWSDFFIEHRLKPQIELAQKNKLLDKGHIAAFTHLFQKTSLIFETEKPALLHGDLWSGNFICNERSMPVLIDPAVYFGHRSMDLAMTTLFGGFDRAFYDAYHYHHPLPSNYREQWDVCNLYPLLIHLNLFGRGYLSQVTSILKQFS